MTLDERSLEALIKRFDKAPARMQNNAMRSVARAGANVVKQAAKARAPGYLANTIKVVPRKAHGKKLQVKMSVIVGDSSKRLIDIQKPLPGETFDGHSTADYEFSNNYPAIWVEFGTYAKRDYKGKEPYSPDTLKKKSYASGRSNSPMWNVPSKWIDQRPFMRPAINDHVTAVTVAMQTKLDAYLTKKGL